MCIENPLDSGEELRGRYHSGLRDAAGRKERAMATLKELEPRAKEILAREQHRYEEKNSKSREAYQRSCRALRP